MYTVSFADLGISFFEGGGNGSIDIIFLQPSIR